MAEDTGRLPGEVRTYVIRNTNMSPQRREAYRRLAPHYCLSYSSHAYDVRAAFPRSEAPLIMEIGFGMGYATIELAERSPHINYLGIEVHKPGVARVLRRIEKHELDNLLLVHHDAVEVIRDMLPSEICAGCHIFFPDPWPKKRHHKRRLVQPAFPAFLARVLEPEAYVYLVTDWRDYAEQMKSAFDEAQEFVNRYEDFAPPQRWRPRTPFEKKGIEKAHEIFELYYIRKE